MNEICPQCGSEKVIFDSAIGERKCSECGYVIEETIIDLGPDWRAYDHQQMLLRARAEPINPQREVWTLIGSKAGLSAVKRAEFGRLSVIQEFISKEGERGLTHGWNEVSRLAAAIQASPQVKDEAIRLFSLAQREGLLKGRSIQGIAAASIALACREYGLPNPIPRLCEYVSTSSKDLRRCYLFLLENLGGELKLKPPDPMKYIPMIANRLGLSVEVQRTAAKILTTVAEARILLGKPPRSLAVAALYIASIIHRERRSRVDFAATVGITETTLRKHVKELIKKLDIEILI
ncbi:MAG: TFIIB-type zinc ribbon-containing protein [Thermofilaceae archaeon]